MIFNTKYAQIPNKQGRADKTFIKSRKLRGGLEFYNVQPKNAL